MVKLAAQHAWLDERAEVQPQDIEYAYSIMEELWDNLLFFVESLWGSGYSDKEALFAEILKVGEELPITEYYKRFMEKAKCQETIARRIAKRLEEKGIVQRTGEKSNRRITRLK
jgi:hypothetical protein